LYKVFHYKPKFNDLNISAKNIISAMGYSDQNTYTGYKTILDKLINTAKEIVIPECGFVILSQNTCSASNGVVSLDGIEFITDKIVASPLKKISGAAIFVGTVGHDFDKWSRKTFSEAEPLAGYMIDLLGSEIAESIAEWTNRKIVEYTEAKGLRCSNRYSPGYCGWNVAEQHKLFTFIPQDFCGVSLTESALMKPHKSVSGIIGISPVIKWEDYPCEVCNVEHCYKNRDKKLGKV